MNQKSYRQPKRQKQANRKNKNSQQSRANITSSEHVVTRVVTVKELGGFPSVYRWSYPVSTLVNVLTTQSIPTSEITYPLNYPQSVVGLGYVPLSSVYDNYVVVGSSIRVDFLNKSTTTSFRCNITPYDEDGALPTATDSKYLSNPFSVNHLVGPAGSVNTQRLETAVTLQSLAGYNKPVDQFADALSGYTGGVNSSIAFTAPTDKYGWYVSASTSDGTNFPATTVYFSVLVIYDILFFGKLPAY